jgi:hypothetical protein
MVNESLDRSLATGMIPEDGETDEATLGLAMLADDNTADDADDESEASALDREDHDMSNAQCVFMLTSLNDSGHALEAARRLYRSSLGGLRFSSELNRAIPRGRASSGHRIH